jgi:hypothetical protein
MEDILGVIEKFSGIGYIWVIPIILKALEILSSTEIERSLFTKNNKIFYNILIAVFEIVLLFIWLLFGSGILNEAGVKIDTTTYKILASVPIISFYIYFIPLLESKNKPRSRYKKFVSNNHVKLIFETIYTILAPPTFGLVFFHMLDINDEKLNTTVKLLSLLIILILLYVLRQIFKYFAKTKAYYIKLDSDEWQIYKRISNDEIIVRQPDNKYMVIKRDNLHDKVIVEREIDL